ncbi:MULTISPECIES: stiblene epoxidase [Photorhabdus]|uniref:NAD(P)-binding protein n=2 Tax=Photorhabdus TaxID=29487 RepID=A0ABX0AZH0_9GAMM|nr:MULTISPECIES: stiblene epoxidase [Photorhabdus]MCC8374844.1 FAD-dependent monooxygenase [Photorhabdus bodei]MCC8466924.1 FAD-dependent monooxygenase [Photorhabdus bodei]MDB6371005.1 stiblene epoxidase [Photorhabdus bodei]NDL10444.1 NAD(P)-binding protein [Photorhabdus kayaii]NDL23681.1 NAD(P)-binding protein [Photorhabdus kayaii]
MHVGIIGAGIGGTCLAHGLRKNGIKVTIYERNSAASSILPGYGIHINTFGKQALQECLPDENWLTFEEASRYIGGQSRFYNERLRLLAVQGGLMNGQIISEQRLSISRTELRDILSQGLSNTIQWNKTFVRYEHIENGGIKIFFADGSHENVDVLVGADGSNSKVRKQYLPSIERFDVGVSIIIGRARLTPALIALLPQNFRDGTPNSIVPKSPDWLFISMWRAPVNIHVESALAEIDNFIVWVYVAATDSLPDNITNFSAEVLCDLVRARMTSWDPNLHILIKQSDMENISPLHLRSMPHLLPWKSSTVILLGDAIHNMTPMTGSGANTALRDALLLTQKLTQVASGQEELIKAISDYEQQMRVYANEIVGISLRSAQNAVEHFSIPPLKQRHLSIRKNTSQSYQYRR